jgi:hypothetical protein
MKTCTCSTKDFIEYKLKKDDKFLHMPVNPMTHKPHIFFAASGDRYEITMAEAFKLNG